MLFVRLSSFYNTVCSRRQESSITLYRTWSTKHQWLVWEWTAVRLRRWPSWEFLCYSCLLWGVVSLGNSNHTTSRKIKVTFWTSYLLTNLIQKHIYTYIYMTHICLCLILVLARTIIDHYSIIFSPRSWALILYYCISTYGEYHYLIFIAFWYV